MSVYPTWRAGSKVSADRLTKQQTHVVVAAVDLVRVNTTTHTDDTELVFPLLINAMYVVELHAAFAAATANPDVATSWSVPAGVTGGRFCFGATTPGGPFTSNEIARATVRAQTFVGTVNYMQDPADQSVSEILSLITTGTAGTLAFRWAQNTLDAINSVTRLADSFMRVTRVG